MARSFSGREKNLLAALAVAAVLFAAWRLTRDAPESERPAASETNFAAVSEESPRVHMDLLAREAALYDGRGRDLFKYAPRPPSPAELRRLRAEAERQRKMEEEARRRAEEEARRRAEEEAQRQAQLALNPPPPPKPQPPPITFKYIGNFGPKESRVVAFEDGKGVFVARVGEVVREQFRVVEIKHNAVVMGYTREDFRSQVKELPLSGGR
jgi:hypothetical protein